MRHEIIKLFESWSIWMFYRRAAPRQYYWILCYRAGGAGIVEAWLIFQMLILLPFFLADWPGEYICTKSRCGSRRGDRAEPRNPPSPHAHGSQNKQNHKGERTYSYEVGTNKVNFPKTSLQNFPSSRSSLEWTDGRTVVTWQTPYSISSIVSSIVSKWCIMGTVFTLTLSV